MAGSYSFLIEQGSTLSLSMTWKDENGTAINITGYTARLMCRWKISDTTPFLTLTTENTGITLGGSAGTILLSYSATNTAALVTGIGVYDLEIVSGSGVVTRLLSGKVTITPEVTR